MPRVPTYVTQPFLPPLEEFAVYLEDIWESKILTNGGPKHDQLEQALADYLGIRYLSLFSSGTTALLVALQALRISGEVITTPYSFVATANSLLWHGLTPVFVDVDERTLNIDPSKIEAAITPQTMAVMPVHCYGNPCDIDAIQSISENYNLRVIYDAAHAFGVNDAGGSVLRHGDLSVLSFHATKVFNTFEGGAIICPDEKTKKHIDRLKNFGFADEVTVTTAGINGKMSEINAAFGLLQLKYVDELIDRRGRLDHHYRERLASVKGIMCLPNSGQVRGNYAYFPILVGDDFSLSRDELYMALRKSNIFARRYFYPLISNFPMYRNFASASPLGLPVATRAAASVICLPLYADLDMKVVDEICDLIECQ